MKSNILEATAITSEKKMLFHVRKKLDYLTNDSDTYDLKINFDGDIGQRGTRTLQPLEVIDDIIMDCDYITVMGVGGSVNFRISGV